MHKMGGTAVILIVLAMLISCSHFLHKQGMVTTYFGSITSSSSLVPSRDGQLHQQVQQVHSEISHNGFAVKHTQSTVTCRDGLCQHEKLQMLEPVATAKPQINFVPEDLERRSVQRLRGSILRIEEPRTAIRQVSAPSPMEHSSYLVPATIAIVSLVLFGTVAMSAFFAAKDHNRSVLAGLGEPLAPAQEVTRQPQLSRRASKRQAQTLETIIEEVEPVHMITKAILSSVYAQVMTSHKSANDFTAVATRAYLLRVYTQSAL